MVKRIVMTFSFIMLCACGLFHPTTNKPSDRDFPLTSLWIKEVDEKIDTIAVSNDWIAAITFSKLIALDSLTGMVLWEKDFYTDSDTSIFMTNNLLIVPTIDGQVLLIDKEGKQIALNLNPGRGNPKLISAHERFVYLKRVPEWILEVYDIDKNKMLWDLSIPRGGINIHYEPIDEITHITTLEFIRSYLPTGNLLLGGSQEISKSTYKNKILYSFERIGEEDYFSARKLTNQNLLWYSPFNPTVRTNVHGLELVDDSVVIAHTSSGLIGVDSANGNVLWICEVDDEFFTMPIKLGDYVYARGNSKNIYAISPDNGVVVGYLHTGETESYFLEPHENVMYGLHKSNDRMIFNTDHAILAYASK